MKSATKDKEYTSPVSKLARFFEKSRDQWKAKCREAKRMLKRLKSRNRFLQKSRDQWRQKAQRFEAQVKKTGGPREIVSDHGTDLKAGIKQFCAAHSETAAMYDIKHKTAAVLKRELGQDATWLAFVQQANQTKRQVQQTALAPPGQRSQARYMNVDVLLAWGRHALAFLDNLENEAGMFDPGQVQQKLGWVAAFRHPLAAWHALLQVVTTTESYIRQRGLYQGVPLELEAQLEPLADTEQAQKVSAELVAFVAQEAAKAQPGERLLGSSEIIESVLGKQKRLEQDQAKNGFTGFLLALCASVADTTADVVRQALETVPTKKVLGWCRENLGQSVQAQRRAAFSPLGRKEQKWDQSWTPV